MTPRKQRRIDRRAERRRGMTPVRSGGWSDMAPFIEEYGRGRSYVPAGYFDKSKNEIVTFKDSEDIKEHELTHAEQYSGLDRILAKHFNIYGGLSVQNPTIKKAQKSISKSLTDSNYEGMNQEEEARAKYMLTKPHEFEAIVSGAMINASDFGIDFSQDFESIKSQLNSLSKEYTSQRDVDQNSNLRLIRDAMNALKTKEQKDSFMSAIRSKL